MLTPVFAKGDVRFVLNGESHAFTRVNVSSFGIMGLPWRKLSPQEHSGKPVEVEIILPGPPPILVRTRGYLLRERTLRSETLGIRLLLPKTENQTIEKYVEQHGHYPTEYVRKYPRIPSMSTIQTFPLRAMVTPMEEGFTTPMVLDVANLSPSGILLMTENRLVNLIPGQRIKIVLEPRGWFPTSVAVEGLTCRVADDLNVENGNLVRYVGVKFSKIDEINRVAFLDLLKDILQNAKSKVAPG